MTGTEQSSETKIQAAPRAMASYGFAGVVLGVGVAGLIAHILRRNRRVVEWIIPLGLIVGGVAVFFVQRQSRIYKVTQQVRAELDPGGRAQVLASVADEESDIQARLNKQ